MRLYLKKNVVEATNERLNYVFAHYKNIVVSVSGGKDSHTLFDLVYKKAETQNRKINTFFLDQEAEYQSTIDVIKDIMYQPNVIPYWYQVPCEMTSAVSYEDDMLYAWGPGEEWMREKDPIAIHSLENDYPQRFYPFINWFEKQWNDDTCFLVGLRSEESLNRYRAVIKNPGVGDILWSTKGDTIKFYPIYDWSFEDVFLYFYLNNINYNRIYDFMHSKDTGIQITKYRVSNLIHEKAYKSLATLQEFEHDTYEKLAKRLRGVRTAGIYAEENTIYSNVKRPDGFNTWKEYRDYLLETMPENGRKQVYCKRFNKQKDNEHVYRQQCKQLLINDWENNVPVINKKEGEGESWREKWMKIL